MARKEITTPLDLSNMNNHNQNYKELYREIQATDQRLSDDMWDELRDANTMKMLEPIQTYEQLPEEAEDKSLITVIDEQRVYAYVYDEWQPFSEIDLDPFEPFKVELAEIVAQYEAQIQDITQELQSTKDSAIESIQSTQSTSESKINITSQTAIDAVNQVQAEAESQINTVRQELSTQASELTALFNDYLERLTSNRDITLAEVEDAKQQALDALANFQNTDTSNWQKYKLTDDKGASVTVGLNNDLEQLHNLPNGRFYATSTPIDLATSTAGLMTVEERDTYSGLKRIEFRPYNSTQKFVKRKYDTWFDWEPADGTKVTLYEGSASGVDAEVTLSAPYDLFSYLLISFNSTPGRKTFIYDAQISDVITINVGNVYNDATNGKFYEMEVSKTSLTKLTVTNEVSYTFSGSGSFDSTVEIEKIVGVK